jgi:formylglycine-generating enzyme required for sulfatase activity
LQQDPIFLPDDVVSEFTSFDAQLLDFLIAGQLKKERLSEVWERLERQDGSAEAMAVDILLTTNRSTLNPVVNALDNFQTLIDTSLRQLLSDVKPVIQTQPPVGEHRLVNKTFHERSGRKALWRVLRTGSSRLRSNFFAAPPRLGLEFVLIQAGTFHMGSTVFNDEQPLHQVRISRLFYLGKYPVTQGQWAAVMGNNPSYFRSNPNRPVENASWEGVQEFIHKLNEREGSVQYRLPTEAEWEYAARADSTTGYCFGNDSRRLGQYAWYKENSGGRTHLVGQLKPNAWGLYDMYGNVWEWVQDWYDEEYYVRSLSQDPHGPSSGLYRVVRGGGWDCGAGDCRSASRNVEAPGNRTNVIGFRLLKMVLQQISP